MNTVTGVSGTPAVGAAADKNPSISFDTVDELVAFAAAQKAAPNTRRLFMALNGSDSGKLAPMCELVMGKLKDVIQGPDGQFAELEPALNAARELVEKGAPLQVALQQLNFAGRVDSKGPLGRQVAQRLAGADELRIAWSFSALLSTLAKVDIWNPGRA